MRRNKNGRGGEAGGGGLWQPLLPRGLTGRRPPLASDSHPHRYTARWFKAIITSTLADGCCLSHGCWCLMNETLVNTTKNMIREPPCRLPARRREKKTSTQMCPQHRHPHTHVHTPPSPPARHPDWIDQFYYCSSSPLNKRCGRGKGTSGGKHVSVCACVISVFRVRRHQTKWYVYGKVCRLQICASHTKWLYTV